MMKQEQVCVVIAAMDSRLTIGRAIGSALAQPEVAEVVVVDDASRDGTAEAAAQADDGSARLQIIRLPANIGPAAARNIAIAQSKSALIAPLDADDFVLHGRFASLLGSKADWDAIADNVLFIPEAGAAVIQSQRAFGMPTQDRIGLAQFCRSNIACRGRPRGELGFVKPVIRRRFLERHGLRYDESLRLGEDYELYARMLINGARFYLSRSCGYVAVERPTSLSSSHRPEDLNALMLADDRLLREEISSVDRTMLQLHRAHIAARWHHREILARRKSHGMLRVLLDYAAEPRPLLNAALGIARDKAEAWLPGREHPGHTGKVRLLMPLPGTSGQTVFTLLEAIAPAKT